MDRLKTRGKGIKNYTSALCGLVFKPEELQTCSLTGKACNFKKAQNSQKSQLDPHAVEGVIGKAHFVIK